MSERRSHWTDDLIEAVYAELPAKKYQVEPDSWEVHRIIAAVEDWVLSAPIFDLYLSRKHAPDKAAIQRVRELHRQSHFSNECIECAPGGIYYWPCPTVEALADGAS